MIRNFNKDFISEFEDKDYERCLSNPQYLEILKNNYNCRYNSNYDKFNSTINAFKESLDHYVLMKMEDDPEFIKSSMCDNYFKYLQDLSRSNRYDFYTNVVLFNVLNNSKFSEYKRKYGLNNQLVDKKFGQAMIDINHIITKVRHDKTVSQDELNLLCAFVSDYRENTEILYEVIEYIFNNLTMEDSLLRCSPQVISAVVTYIPYACNEIKKNGFNPASVRIFVANRYHYKEYETEGRRDRAYSKMGSSLSDCRQIILPGRVSQNTNFKSIASSENPFSFEEYFKNNDYSFTLMLLTLYHEITHQYQEYMFRKEYSTVLVDKDIYIAGLPMALRVVLDNEFNDYNRNHDNDDIEIHATQVAWEMCASFYSRILADGKLKNELVTRSNRNKNGTQTRYAFSVKENSAGELIDANEYTLNNCSSIMKNPDKRAKYFDKIPCLRHIFTDDGRFKIDILLIKDFGYTQIGASLLEKLINSPGIDSKIAGLIKQSGNSNSINNTIAHNIYMGINLANRKLYMLEYYTRKDFNDSFKVNRTFVDTINNILAGQENTIRNGKRILNQVLRCNAYDDLLNNNRKRALEYYKQILDNISKSNNLSNKGRK